ncbi:MAG: hypothetical protein QI223_00850 [Candidatus Korarchaeota archaeon]|nr:hypothetical protein [Candidatus Korarchaeota archaeon]
MRRVLRESLGIALNASLLLSALAMGALLRGLGERASSARLREDIARLGERAESLRVTTVVRYPWGGEVQVPSGAGGLREGGGRVVRGGG